MAKRTEEEKQNNLEELQRETGDLIQGLAGTISSPGEAVKSLSHAVTGLIQGRGLKSFGEAWQKQVEAGAIDPKYIENPWGQKQFNQILIELNREDVDEQRVKALINIFINSAKNKSEDNEALRVVSYMKIISKLDAVDIKLLSLLDQLRIETLDEEPLYTSNANSWEKLILERSGLEMLELVAESEEKLVKHRLITDRDHSDRSGVQRNNNYRLTELGVRVCAYMKEASTED